MKPLKPWRLLALIALLTLAVFAATACGDDDEDTGDDAGNGTREIAIMEPFGRAALDRASAYFTIQNNGAEDDALVKASAPVADTVELHETVTEGAETKMQPVEQIDVPAGGEVELKPGGLHVMLTDLTQELKEGDSYTMTLEFQSGLTMDVDITVESYSSDSGMGDGEEMGDGMDGGMDASPTAGM